MTCRRDVAAVLQPKITRATVSAAMGNHGQPHLQPQLLALPLVSSSMTDKPRWIHIPVTVLVFKASL